MSIATELRSYAETAVEQGKTAAAESAKPLYAIVGAGDFAVDKAKKALDAAAQRAQELRTSAEAKVTDLRDSLSKTAGELGELVQTVPGTVKNLDVNEVREGVRGSLEKAVDTYTSKAYGYYGEFVRRGELIVEGLSKDVRKTANDTVSAAQTLIARGEKAATDAVADAAAVVADRAEEIEAEVAPRKAGARKAARTRAARAEAPARRTAATKAPAKKAPAKKAAAKKAPARKTTATSAPAKAARAAKSTASKATAAASNTAQKAADAVDAQ